MTFAGREAALPHAPLERARSFQAETTRGIIADNEPELEDATLDFAIGGPRFSAYDTQDQMRGTA